ncbi:MarR family winged helix-turn-helix transcriptional regulator [Microbacterium sp. cx-55]|uniref:MarR family winged helix-turn-helix transcriptional regulator n=1 Tax=unclassified Microbacterium TaxID=2609290 RepID=UPI001CBCDDAF|nr:MULTISPECIES: MarR family winged helix-turn-helix transcriptional regulator [unclassified Microbacterium]MBZ4488448.1 MarR family winged helix-turn-helix transcriptional regulator [Microbacterium sp. cx-55]MCC4909490.1 MarR family winged helix-turn-helix transcriptional regulator [Microbacterium sp. cx-59]UGB35096.1 MarR family winged helix-turn-helix transcriptional regulator [Microbacterium sp. cx-55]
MSESTEFPTAQDAANDPRILLFGRLLGAANRLDYLLGRALEENYGISHSTFELLLLVGRAGAGGIPIRDIAQGRVVTSGGATRLVQRAVTDGLVERRPSPDDARVQLVTLTAQGTQTVLRASEAHVENIQRYLIDNLPAGDVETFARAIRMLSLRAGDALPVMP